MNGPPRKSSRRWIVGCHPDGHHKRKLRCASPPCDEPEPDISIIRGSDDDYKHRNAEAADVAILVEVSESSPSHDRTKKLPVYSKAGIPVYWIVNLVDRQVEVYTSPGPSGYQSYQVYLAGDLIPVVIDGQVLAPIAVDDILP